MYKSRLIAGKTHYQHNAKILVCYFLASYTYFFMSDEGQNLLVMNTSTHLHIRSSRNWFLQFLCLVKCSKKLVCEWPDMK